MMGPKKQSSMGPGVKEMRGPSGVDDILNMVNNKKPVVPKEETVSSVSSQESGMRKIKMKRPVAEPQKNGKFVLNLQ